MYKEWLASQFEVKIVTEGKYKGKVCFKTPLFRYTLSKEDWVIVKDKINRV